MKIAHIKDLQFSRQVNYPDLAYNIQAVIYELTVAGKAGVHGLEILDIAYRGQSKTYADFSDKYGKRFRGLLQSSLTKNTGTMSGISGAEQSILNNTNRKETND